MVKEGARENYQNPSEWEKVIWRKKAWDRYQNVFEEVKEKKRQYHRHQNLSEQEKQKKVEYMNYCLVHKK